MITHSFVMAVLDSHAIFERQVRWLTRILSDNWELIIVDDASTPELILPAERPKHCALVRREITRKDGEWTQHGAVNHGVSIAQGDYILKSDVDHIFTPEAIQAAEQFTGNMMLFHREAGVLADDFSITPLDHPVHGIVDDIFVMRTALFRQRGGYVRQLRQYGRGGKDFWDLSQQPEALPPADAVIYVTPDTHERYHALKRIVVES